jgi:ABC-type bacteriocin/lantibiotic exporter with double-glycine peptidase domain
MVSHRTNIQLATASFRQRRAMCGPACLRIVFTYFGKHVPEKQIAQACRTSLSSGTTGKNLVNGARRFGFHAEVIDHSNFRTIAKWLRRGVPVIVNWMSTISKGKRQAPMAVGHYSVVCGLGKEHIVLQDPAFGERRRLSRRAFQSVWFDFKCICPRTVDDLIIRRVLLIAPPVSDNSDRVGPVADVKKSSPHSELRRKSGTRASVQR